MLATILIVTIALYWLARESDYLRIRLLAGIEAIQYERKSWDEIKPTCKLTKQYPFWLRFPEHMSPLCGLDWLENTMHVIPEYKLELVGVGYKTTIHSNNAQALRDACRVNRNPWLKVKI